MTIEFHTIEIEKLVISYLGIFGSFLAAHFLLDLTVHAAFFLVLPVGLYFCFRGKVKITIGENNVKLTWLCKPWPHTFDQRSINLAEIIRWKYEHNFRGPDRFTMILESGERIKIYPALFVVKDVETRLVKTLEERISKANSDVPKDIILQKIQKSGYVKKLSYKIRKIKIFGWILLGFTLGLLPVGAFFPDSRGIWMSFFIASIGFLLIQIRLYDLKNEKKNTLRVE